MDCLGERGDTLPDEVLWWQGDYIISYLSPWILSESLLNRARMAAINFHPATPEYPGTGCINFALYENAPEYGAMCHHMASKVDTGTVIAVKRFPVFASDTVETLLERTYDHQLILFYEMIALIAQGKPLPVSPETWTRPPFTRKQLNALSVITVEMNAEEIAKRIRATSFRQWKPVLELNGFKFEYKGS